MSHGVSSSPKPPYSNSEDERHIYYYEGRRMLVQGSYFLPVDEEEFERLESVHQMTTAVLGGLYWGPVDEMLEQRPNGRRACALDVGTGTGAWVREMALEYPNVDFIGTDIVQTPPPAQALVDKNDGVLSPAVCSCSSEAVSSSNLSELEGSVGTRVTYTDPSNVRFEIHDLAKRLNYPNDTFDIVHCRYVLALGVPGYEAAVQELLRVLRPGGLLLLAETSIPFCLSDGTDPPFGTASRELVEIVRAFMRAHGLDPELRLSLKSKVQSNPLVERAETCNISLPFGDWPVDEDMQHIGRVGLESLIAELRSLTPLLRQTGYDDAMISMLISRLYKEWDARETGTGFGKALLCTFLWAVKR